MFAVTFIFFTLLPCHAAQTSPGLKSVIQEAQNLALEKKRVEAAELLRKSGSQKKIRQELKQIAEMFFTDKGQRLFEAADAMIYNRPTRAMSHLQEAETVEGPNTEILKDMARIHLENDECSNAQEAIKKALHINPYDATMHLLAAEAELCAKESKMALAELEATGSKKFKETAVYFLNLAIAEVMEGNTSAAIENLNQAALKDSRLPEVQYWLWKLNHNLGAGEKYLVFCKNVTTKLRRKYKNQPKLCSKAKEVENEIQALQQK